MSDVPQVILPNFLRPRYSDSLVRVGKSNDGGYLVDGRDLNKARALLSAGLGTDWSFEAEFYALTSVPVLAYDASVSGSLLTRLLLKRCLCRPWDAHRYVQRFLSYRLFFRKDRQHIKKFIGEECGGYQHVSIERAFQKLSITEPESVYVKLDIEGAEYRVLEDLVRMAHLTCGLVIEFHDFDVHVEQVAAFVDAYPLHLVHVHCNNGAPASIARSLPYVIECSFTSSCPRREGVANLPHYLDMPNDPRKAEYKVVF